MRVRQRGDFKGGEGAGAFIRTGYRNGKKKCRAYSGDRAEIEETQGRHGDMALRSVFIYLFKKGHDSDKMIQNEAERQGLTGNGQRLWGFWYF